MTGRPERLVPTTMRASLFFMSARLSARAKMAMISLATAMSNPVWSMRKGGYAEHCVNHNDNKLMCTFQRAWRCHDFMLIWKLSHGRKTFSILFILFHYKINVTSLYSGCSAQRNIGQESRKVPSLTVSKTHGAVTIAQCENTDNIPQ